VGIDVGKDAKRAGKEHPRNAKQRDQEPVRVPPHRKNRKYKLVIEWTDTTTWRREKEFTTKAARDEARRRIEREFREIAEKEKAKKPSKYRSWLNRSPFTDFDDLEVTRLKSGPEYQEILVD